MNGLGARELRCFVAVAEELHFGRAAARLRVAQPAVSRTVARLERRLGVRLLDRSTRHVRLTAAGAVLLAQAPVALDALAAAEHLTVRAGGPRSEVVVAVKPDGDAGLLEPVIAAYGAEPASPALRPLLVGPAELTACLRDGRADVALLPHPFDGRGLGWEEILHESRVVALPAGHPLAAADELSLRDLSAEPVARWANVHADLDAFYRGLDAGSTSSGIGEGPLVYDLAEALRLVELGRAVTFLARSVAERYAARAIAYRPVTDLSPSRMVVAWRQPPNSPAARAFFVRTACAVAGARATAADAPATKPT